MKNVPLFNLLVKYNLWGMRASNPALIAGYGFLDRIEPEAVERGPGQNIRSMSGHSRTQDPTWSLVLYQVEEEFASQVSHVTCAS